MFFSFFVLLDIFNLFVLMHLIPKRKDGFSRAVKDASRFLIVGDSTAVGTGAKDPKQTIAGFLAKDFPTMSIENLAKNGSRTKAVLSQLELADCTQYEGIFISTGGNDVWAFTPLTQLRNDIRAVLRKGEEMSRGRVVLIFFGNEGSAPFFPYIFRSVLMWRTRQVLEVFRQVSIEQRVPLIELFTTDEENPFVKDPKKYFAVDGLHPSQAGYWEWYKRLWRLMLKYEHNWSDRDGDTTFVHSTSGELHLVDKANHLRAQ